MDSVDSRRGPLEGIPDGEGDPLPFALGRDQPAASGRDVLGGVSAKPSRGLRRRWRRKRIWIPAVVILAAILASGGVVAARSLGTSPPPSTALSRFFDPSIPDRYDTTSGAPPGYVKQQVLGYIPNDQASNSRPVFSCLYNRDHFLSPDPGCEGYQTLGRIGWVYITPPPSLQSAPLYRCWTTDQRDHFVSNDPYCEGQLLYGLLGYALQQP